MRRAACVLLFFAASCKTPEGPAPVFGEPVKVNDLDGGTGQSEPSIAVSGDGRTLIAGWVDWSEAVPHVRLARSTDGGATFAASRRVLESDAAHPKGQAEATVAWNAGVFAFGWIGCRPDPAALDHACDVHVMKSADGGATWSAAQELSEGGPARRDRPWLAPDGDGFLIAWSEVGPAGMQWVVGRENEKVGWRFIPVTDRAAMAPPSEGKDAPEFLHLDRSRRDPKTLTLAWYSLKMSRDGGPVWTFPREAALLPYSLGAFAADREGSAWAAIPSGDGTRSDFALHHRSNGRWREAGTLRTPEAQRVGLPWIAAASRSRFVAAWIEDESGKWRVRTRILGPGAARSAAADVSRTAFSFHEASRTENIGDFLSVTSAGDDIWVAWSDTRDGDADVWISKGRAP